MAMAPTMGDWDATAIAMATELATELATATEMASAMAMTTATARVTITKEGLPLHVAEMCSAFGGATPCLHPNGHTGKCIHQHCIMEVTLLRWPTAMATAMGDCVGDSDGDGNGDGNGVGDGDGN